MRFAVSEREVILCHTTNRRPRDAQQQLGQARRGVRISDHLAVVGGVQVFRFSLP
jgi:hypothetical protein